MQDLPLDVQEYLTAGDGLGRKAVEAKHPGIRQKLAAPETRAALLRYLGSDEPWQEASPGAAISALGVLQSGAAASEIPALRPLLLHPQGMVRLGAYEFMLAVYYPAGRDLMLTLLQDMLVDPDDLVRAQSARLIKGLKDRTEFNPFLDRWLKLARQRGWDKHESYAIVSALRRP